MAGATTIKEWLLMTQGAHSIGHWSLHPHQDDKHDYAQRLDIFPQVIVLSLSDESVM